jgi:hypothetical protein
MTTIRSFKDLALAMVLDHEVGDWFAVLDADVIVAEGKNTGYPFAEHKAAKGLEGRRVIVASCSAGPAVRVYARNSHEDGQHPPHKDCEPSCKIDRRGAIRLNVPCTVKTKVLVAARWSCTEDDEALLNYLQGATR